jgi:hypothetical protein
MNKDFVPYEPSLALKELGFDEPCLAHWYNETPTNSEGQCLVYYKKPWDNQKIINGVIRDYYFAPTYSQAFRFFREKYGLYHSIGLDNSLENNINCDYQIINHSQSISELETSFKSYEEAELACLKKLIEIVKNN